jgi:hypothetical protein
MQGPSCFSLPVMLTFNAPALFTVYPKILEKPHFESMRLRSEFLNRNIAEEKICIAHRFAY